MKYVMTILLSPFIVTAYFIDTVLKAKIFIGAFKKWNDGRKPTHGDADFTDKKELKKLGHYERKGWLVGVHEKRRFYTLAEASGLGISGKGQGKSLTAVAQLQDIATREFKDDVVCVDPTGELTRDTRDIFQANGYAVTVIDFTDVLHSACYDVLGIIDTNDRYNFDRQIEQFGLLVMPDDKHTTNDHFQQFARIMFTGLLAHMLIEHNDEATLDNVVDILTTDVKRRSVYFREMESSTNRLVKQAVSSFNEAGDKERGSFGTTMGRKLKVWLRAAVAALTKTHEYDSNGRILRGWTWEQIYLSNTPHVVYIITGLGTDEGAAARLIMGNAINARRYLWNKTRRKPAKDLRLLVDEAREIGYCNAVIDANNELRKAGVTTMLWYLTSRDIFTIYGDDAVTLIQNSDLLVFGGSKEKSFMEDVSWMVGEKTIENLGRSESDHGESQSLNEQARRVIKPDEIRRMDFYDGLYVSARISAMFKKPFRLKDGKLTWL